MRFPSPAPAATDVMEVPAARRLFVALMPPPEVRDAITEAARGWRWSPSARPTARERLHLTMHFLGDVADDRLEALEAGLSQVVTPPFTLPLLRGELWGNGIAALRPGRLRALQQLHAALGAALEALGLPLEQRAWRPHVTLARDARGSLAPPPSPPLAWPVDGFALVWSRPLPTPGYEVLRQWPALR